MIKIDFFVYFDMMKLDDVNHELPHTSDVGLHVWVEVVGDDGDVDGQLMTVQRAP